MMPQGFGGKSLARPENPFDDEGDSVSVTYVFRPTRFIGADML